MATRHHDIRVLNRLVSSTLDSAENYRKAMRDARSAELTRVFRMRCRERLAVFDQLRNQVDAIGGDPKDDGSVMAPLKRALNTLYYVFHDGDWAVVEEVDSQEDKLQKKYGAALEDGRLSAHCYQAVLSACETVQSAREELAQLKRAFRKGHG
jgi:uncharacterized protein (TIGR02284 family)